MDQKNARTPKDLEEEDPLDQEESPKKNDYGFGVEPKSKKDKAEEEIDPLDEEDVEEEVDEVEDPLDQEESDPPIHRSSQPQNTEPVEAELDREKTLADLAKEDIEDTTDLPEGEEKPFKTNNIDLDTPISQRNNPYFQSERQHENLRQPDFSRPNQSQSDLSENFEEQNEEIHIPNLRSPRFNSDYMPQRKALDENNDPDIGFGNRGLNSSQNPFERNSFRNSPPPRRGASKLHLIVLLLIGVAVIGGTVYFLKTQFKPNSQVVSEATASPTPTPAPTPTPEPEANRADFKVQVLNGTTTSGLAGEITTKLAELGYRTQKGANAPKQDYEHTLISVKEGQEVLLKTLIKDLSSQFEASSGPTLKASDPLDAQIILGKK